MPQGPLMIDLAGYEISKEEETILKHPMVGGVVLFFKNCKSPKQLKELIAAIRNLRPEIIIAVDREGGNVQRFQKPGFRCYPAARVYGEVYDMEPHSDFWIKFTRHYAETMGDELRELDINLNLAPVLDSHSKSGIIGDMDRAFHADPQVRTQIAAVFTESLQKKGVKTAGKHFIDHGVCEGDSHVTKPICNLDKQTLFEKYLSPYQELIRKNSLDVIMPAHITYTSVDPENTAGFSKIWLNDILREQLGFRGVIISDCLSMTGADIGDMQLRAERALAEGCCDMAIMANQPRPVVLEVLNYLQTKQLEGRFVQSIQSQARLVILASRHKQEVIDYSSSNPHVSKPHNTSSSWTGTLINYGTKALITAGLFFIGYKIAQSACSSTSNTTKPVGPKLF